MAGLGLCFTVLAALGIWAAGAEPQFPPVSPAPPPNWIPYRYPFGKNYGDPNFDTLTTYTLYSTAEYVHANGVDASDPKPEGEMTEAIRIRVQEGPSYALARPAGKFHEELALGNPGNDPDSAQVALLWLDVDNKPISTDDNVLLDGKPPSLKGANWTILNDKKANGAREVYKDFGIPAQAKFVLIVLVYTDVLNTPFPKDLTDVLGSWKGTKKDGKWTFERNLEDCPMTDGMVDNPDVPNTKIYDPNAQNTRVIPKGIGNKGTGAPTPQDTAAMQAKINTIVNSRTTYTLKQRKIGTFNTGYDLKKP
jgi:hypothetical protein